MRKPLEGRKLLVASVGVATVSYVVAACGGETQQGPVGGPDGNTFPDGFVYVDGSGNQFDVSFPLPDGNPFDVHAEDATDSSADAPADAPEGG